MKEIIEKVNAEYNRSWWTWEKLERATFASDYDEDYDDTLTRKYEEGYSDALAMVQRLLETLCVTCHKNTDIVLHGHCNSCYYGTIEKGE